MQQGLNSNGNVIQTSCAKLSYSYSGIRYIAFREKGRSEYLNALKLPFSLLKMMGFLFKNRRELDAVLVVSNSAVLIILTFLVCRISNVKLIQEKSEFPFVLKNEGMIGKIYASIYVNFIYHLFDGMIIMTSSLMEYFRNKTKKNCKKIIIPMTVEPDRFQHIPINNEMGDYIAYCGYMGGNKDGVMNLIQAFSFMGGKYPDLNLLLIGTADKAEINELKTYVSENKISNVVFYGNVNRDDMPNLLANAKVLALARPFSLQSLGGLPDKTGGVFINREACRCYKSW